MAARKAEFFKPKPLADKVPAMGGLPVKEALRRAEDVVAKVAGEFEQSLRQEFAELDALVVQYRATPSDETLDQLFRRIHNLRGQGTTLGFPLITRIGNSFCRYIIERDETRAAKPELIEQHLNALQIVSKQGGGKKQDAIADQVARALEQAVAREITP
jgi:chemotaxis protein histidine kinase CheA